MRARITWKRYEDGGRKTPPTGVGTPPYTTVVRFCDSNETWPPANAWSLVIEKIASQSTEYEWIADVHYLANKAPHDELRPLREFELYEGKKCVATGILLDDAVCQLAGSDPRAN
jgi:hypothetical protein